MRDRGTKIIGRSVLRKEDLPLLTGRARFAADINFENQLHMRVVRSPQAHGNIKSIDASVALEIPGVRAVWTWSDVAEVPPISFRLTPVKSLLSYRQFVLPRDRVRYVGEPIAVVFADEEYLAEDAAELVAIDIEELPVLLSAMDQPAEFSDGLSTEAGLIRKAYGDIETAFSTAHAIVDLRLSIGRHSAVPMETRGAIARYDISRDMLEMHGAAKVPHWNRDQIAALLNRSPQSVSLFEGHVGGGFGVRGELYPEDVLVCLGALRLGRPVKWIEDRREHLVASNHSRQQEHHIRAAVDPDGVILGLDSEFFHDQGGYVRTHGATVPDLTAAMLPGPYRIPAYRALGHIRLTNKTPCGTYRAPGRFESTFVRERLIDAIAAELRIDPIEIRRRNLISCSEMPFARQLDTVGTDIIFDSGDYKLLLDKALNAVDWDNLKDDLARRKSAGELIGVGLAMFVEKSGLGPFDEVHINAESSGLVEVVTGAASLGQGVETVVAQICADTLGVDYENVHVVHGQTDRIPMGMGAFASRVTVMTGEATRIAAVNLRTKALAAASELLQRPRDELHIVAGNIVGLEGPTGPSVSLAAIAASCGNHDKKMFAAGSFRSEHMTYPYGVHIAVVRIDRDTGAVQIERFLIAYDVGKAVNPMLVKGQLVGGAAQGIGGALYEECSYNERGEPLSVTFADYLIPTASEMPAFETLITEDAPSPLNPLGLKGAGEGGTNAVGAAIAAAIDDAIGRPGTVDSLPVSSQRIRAVIRGLDRPQAT